MLYGTLVLDLTLNRVKYLIALTLFDLGYHEIGQEVISRSFDELRGWDKLTALRLAIRDLKRKHPKLARVLDIAHSKARHLLIHNYPEL